MTSANTNHRSGETAEPDFVPESDRLRIAMDPKTTLGQLTKMTLDQYSLLFLKIQDLVLLLDDCPIGMGDQNSEPYVQIFTRVNPLANEIESLIASIGLETKYFSGGPGAGGQRLGQAAFTYINFLQWLGLPRNSWLKSAGRSFSDIEVLKLPDQLISLQGQVRSAFDKWTQIGDFRQSICAFEDFRLLTQQFDPAKFKTLLSYTFIQEIVVRSSQHKTTQDDRDRLLYEIDSCRGVHVGPIRRELKCIASVLVLIQAAGIWLGGYTVDHYSFECLLAAIWDSAEDRLKASAG